MSLRTWTIVGIAGVVLTSCTLGARTRHPPFTENSVLTSQELAAVVGTAQDAYAAVERLRPLFLLLRRAGVRDAPPRLRVFINGSLAGDVEILKTIPLASVESIQRIHASTAFTQLGELRSGDGILLIRLRR